MSSPRYDADVLREHPLGILAAGPCVRAEKLPIPLAVHFATSADLVRADGAYQDGHIITRETPEGDAGVAFLPGDAILTGTQGEVWPVAHASFEATYRPADEGGAFGTDGLFVKAPLAVWARRMDGPFALRAAWGRLEGESGDWLVEYGVGDLGVVGAAIFAETYRILASELPAALR